MLLLLILSVLLASSALQLGTWVDSTLPKAERLLIGIGLIFSLLLIINILFPITWGLSLGIFFIPSMYLVTRHHRWSLFQQFVAVVRQNLFQLLVGLSIALGISYAGSFPTTWYDSLLYHIPTVINLIQSPVVSGIALIHIRLASVSLPFVFSSLQASLPNLGSYNFPSVFFFVILGLLYFFEKRSLHLKNLKASTSLWFFFINIAVFFVVHGLSLFSTLAPELVLFVCSILLVYGYLQRRLTLVVAAFILGFVTKISMLLFLPFVIMMIGEKLYSHRSLGTLMQLIADNKRRLIALLLPVIIGSLYSFIVSGCFVFPIKQTCLPLKNALTELQVTDYTKIVHTWARFNPYQSIMKSEVEWFSSYFIQTIPPILKIVFALTTLLMVVTVVVGASKQKSFINYREVFAIVFLFFTMITAYKTAPDFRLLWPMVLSFVALFTATVLTRFQRVFQLQLNVLVIGTFLFVLISLSTITATLEKPLRESQLLYPIETIYNQSAQRQTSSFSSFTFTAPVSGDDRCGVASFPCILDPSVLSSYTYSVDSLGRLTGVYHR